MTAAWALGTFGAIGFVAGLTSGLFGVGGGIVMVPSMILLLPILGVDPEVVVHLAIGTSLAMTCFTSPSSAWAHYRRGGIDRRLFLAIAFWLALGAVAGVQLAAVLPGIFMKTLFAVYACIIAFKLARSRSSADGKEIEYPSSWLLIVFGLIIGSVSSLIGVAGGAMLVPLFLHFHVREHRAVGTSSVCSVPLVFCGTINYLWAVPDWPQMPPDVIGFVYWPALLAVIIPSILGSQVGARIAHILPRRALRLMFAAFLCYAGIFVLLR